MNARGLRCALHALVLTFATSEMSASLLSAHVSIRQQKSLELHSCTSASSASGFELRESCLRRPNNTLARLRKICG